MRPCVGIGLVLFLCLASCTQGLAPTALPTRTVPSPSLLPLPSRTPVPSLTPRPPVTRLVPTPLSTSAPWIPTEHPELVLAQGVVLLDTLPVDCIYTAAWNPEGTRLAYAYTLPDGALNLEVTTIPRPADGSLLASWSDFEVSNMMWTPDGSQILFFHDYMPLEKSIGLLRPGESSWRWLEKGDHGPALPWLWIDDTKFLYWTHCGTECGHFFIVDIVSGQSTRADITWSGMWAQRVVFSPDRRWFAVRNWEQYCAAGRWEDRRVTPISAALPSGWAEPQFWDGPALAMLVYPPGPAEVADSPGHRWPLDLYLQDMETGALRRVARGAYRAFLDPTGRRAVLFMTGEPRPTDDGLYTTGNDDPYLALLDWPSGQLLQSVPMGGKVFELPYHLEWNDDSLAWSPDGSYLVFRPRGDGLAWMDRDGKVGMILTQGYVQWAEWGADGVLAILVKGRVLLVRVGATSSKLD